MKNKFLVSASLLILTIGASLFNACAPLKEFSKTPTYEGNHQFNDELPVHDPSKKTVVIVANNNGTELFDMMAPFYLFNATGKANVYIVAKDKAPIVVKKGLFVKPQLTFSLLDSLRIKPDVVVIPFLMAADSVQQDPVLIDWIRKQYSPELTILAICDGSATAAATRLYDGKPLTAHASDFEGIRKNFKGPAWVQNISYTNEGNLYSTAGVSNATEGSLAVISKLFGNDVMKKVIEDIHYPYSAPKLEHESKGFKFPDKVQVGKKILFKKNRRIGVFLQNGINELDLAGIMDTYNRTIPGSIESFSEKDETIQTKFGLTIVPTGKIESANINELHIIGSGAFYQLPNGISKAVELVQYDHTEKVYILEKCFSRINAQYGDKYEHIVKLMLDYN